MNERAQMGIELVVGAVFVLFVFVGVLIVAVQQSESARLTGNATLEMQACNGLAQTVGRVYASGPASEVRVNLLLDANIEDGFILVGETFCAVHADAGNAILNAGTVILRNASGTVEAFNG